ncbi:hypothetical protein N657DRAFT_639833 [Parathielavia appendiculata]|uniref:Uncharacterized protein n=1 Tax=Parathielavia appendiculata TaxID=2587402 RepID=A0AAN6UAV6_9PEZI|nr:hypothetical protein N657DRAFT_639833 [Parathielavia appendiculata]
MSKVRRYDEPSGGDTTVVDVASGFAADIVFIHFVRILISGSTIQRNQLIVAAVDTRAALLHAPADRYHHLSNPSLAFFTKRQASKSHKAPSIVELPTKAWQSGNTTASKMATCALYKPNAGFAPKSPIVQMNPSYCEGNEPPG